MIFASKKQLGVSWVQGEFTVALLQGHKFIDSWHTADLVHTLDDFHVALNKAVQHFDAQRADISIVYEAQELSHPLVQVPPLSEHDFKLFINHRAEQEKTSEEPILFSYRKSLTQQNKGGVLLHIINKKFVDELTSICLHLKLFPVKLLPLSEIMEHELFRFEPKDHEVILIIAAFSDMTEILVTRGDGKVLFLRDLKHSATRGEITRLSTEIKRSMFYTAQQFNIEVNRIGIIGEEAGSIAQALRAHISIPIQNAKDSIKTHFWAEEAVHLSSALESNLLPIQTLFIRSSKYIKYILEGFVAITFLAAMVMLANVEYQIWEESSKPHTLNLETEKLLSEKAHLSHQITSIQTAYHQLVELKQSGLAAVPVWFLTQLSIALPQGLALKDSQVTYEQNSWHFSLKGTVLGLTSSGPQQLEIFERNLRHLNLNVSITHSWQDDWIQSIQQGGHASKAAQFTIEGVIQ
ncbi:MAG: hypothetical protein R8M46_02935 [Ghiorsea sp.]